MKPLKKLSRLFTLHTGWWCDQCDEARHLLIGLRASGRKRDYDLRNGLASCAQMQSRQHEILYQKLVDLIGEDATWKAYHKYVT